MDPPKKIKKVEVIIEKGERWIDGINFYDQQGISNTHGILESVRDFIRSDPFHRFRHPIKKGDGRAEVFEIADDELLIGCKLD